jgi:thioesterase domain-containing protein
MGQPRKKSPRGPAAIREAKDDNEALAMRAEGQNLDAICERFGLNHREQAARMIDRAMARVPRENAQKLRNRWDDTLERARLRTEEIMNEDHYAVSNGKIVTYNGKPVLDRMPNVAAAKALVDVGKRVAALGGLDAPTRKSVEVVTESAVDRRIAELERDLSVNDHRCAAREAQASS